MKSRKILSLLFVLDRLIKWYAVDTGAYVLNYGVSFGVAKSSLWLVMGLVILFLTVVFLGQSRGAGLIFVGGLGNWIDRVMYGGVVDMFDGKLFWFNLADVMISLGVLMLIYEMIYERKI